MKQSIVRRYDKAIEIAQKYLPQKIDSSKEAVDRASAVSYVIPTEATEGPWALTVDSLKTTFSYLFEHLHHACYVLCVGSNGQPAELFKLENEVSAAPYMREALKNLGVSYDHNGRIRELIEKKSFRVMQCIVKSVAEGGSSTFTKEYFDLLSKMTHLPPGVFVLNLTDAVILDKTGLEPFKNLFPGGRAVPPEYSIEAGRTFLPIMSTSGAKGYWDAVIPNYDDVEFALGVKPRLQYVTDWAQKTIKKAVFRGGPTGCGWSRETNPRIELAVIGQRVENASWIDAGLVVDNKKGKNNGSFVHSSAIKVDPQGISETYTIVYPVEKLAMTEQSKYKYIIHVDGNVHAYRLLNTLRTGSLILRVESEYTGWIDTMLIPSKHYLPIKADLSDLEEKVKWCRANDEECAKIAKAGLELALQISGRKYLEDALRKTMMYMTLSATERNGKSCKPLLRRSRRSPLVDSYYKTGDSPIEPSVLSPGLVVQEEAPYGSSSVVSSTGVSSKAVSSPDSVFTPESSVTSAQSSVTSAQSSAKPSAQSSVTSSPKYSAQSTQSSPKSSARSSVTSSVKSSPKSSARSSAKSSRSARSSPKSSTRSAQSSPKSSAKSAQSSPKSSAQSSPKSSAKSSAKSSTISAKSSAKSSTRSARSSVRKARKSPTRTTRRITTAWAPRSPTKPVTAWSRKSPPKTAWVPKSPPKTAWSRKKGSPSQKSPPKTAWRKEDA